MSNLPKPIIVKDVSMPTERPMFQFTPSDIPATPENIAMHERVLEELETAEAAANTKKDEAKRLADKRNCTSVKTQDKREKAAREAYSAWWDSTKVTAAQRRFTTKLRQTAAYQACLDDEARWLAAARDNVADHFHYTGVSESLTSKTPQGEQALAYVLEAILPYVKKYGDAYTPEEVRTAAKIVFTMDVFGYRGSELKSADHHYDWAAQIATWPRRRKAMLAEFNALPIAETIKIQENRRLADSELRFKYPSDAAAMAAWLEEMKQGCKSKRT